MAVRTISDPWRRCALAGAAVLVAAAAAAPGPAIANPRVRDGAPGVLELASMSLEGLLDLPVSGASRQEQKLSEAAASASVITGEELRALGHRTIADALRTLRGLTVVDDRTYSYLGIRGFFASGDYNTRVLLLVDGNRVNDNLYDQAFIGREAPIDLAQVERIEFIPGQGAAVYGANALFGVVNIVTRSALTPGSGGSLRIGSGGERELQASWQRGGPGLAWLVSASRLISPGRNPVLPEAEARGFAGGVVPGIDHEQVSRVRLAAQGTQGQAQWQASLLGAERAKGIGAPLDVVFGDRRSVDRDSQRLFNFSWQQPWGDGQLGGDWQARVFSGHYRFIGDYALDYPPVLLNRDDDDGRWWGLETRLSLRAPGGHALQFGAEWQRSTKASLRNVDLEGERTVYLDHNSTSRRLGVYAEDRIELGEGWSLTLGLRADQGSGHPVVLSPRLAMIWRASDAWVFKAVHGRAFRPPNVFERDYEASGPGGYVRNPALRSESVRGNELVAEWTPQRSWRLTLAGYETRARDLVVLERGAGDEGDAYIFRNAGAVQLRGLEAEAQWAEHGWRARASLSLQQPKQDASNSFSGQSARRLGKASLVAPLTQVWPALAGWTLGLDGQAVSRRAAAGGSAVLNVHLSRIWPAQGLRLDVGMRNLFDRRWADPGGDAERQPVILQDRRRWALQLGWTL